jgi:hypothetical protein
VLQLANICFTMSAARRKVASPNCVRAWSLVEH